MAPTRILVAFARIFAATAVMVAAVLASASLAHGQVRTDGPGPLQGMMAAFGAVGVVQGQTARLTVVLGNPPDDGSPATTCQARLTILDGAGSLVADATVDVRGGATAQLDYAVPTARGTRLGLGGRARIMLRAVAKAGVTPEPFGPSLGPDPTPFSPCSAPMIATLEVFDTRTEETTIVLNPAVLVGFNPQPDPPMPQAP